MNDLDRMLWKQNEDFKASLRHYGFLAENMVYEKRYDSERQRLDLLEIARLCLEGETGNWWVSMFKDKASHIAHSNLRKWWADRQVLPRSIAALDTEAERFETLVAGDRRDRLAGAPRPTVASIIRQVTGASGKETLIRKESSINVRNPEPLPETEVLF